MLSPLIHQKEANMEALFAPPASSLNFSAIPTPNQKTLLTKSRVSFSQLKFLPVLPILSTFGNTTKKSNSFTTTSSSSPSAVLAEEEPEIAEKEEKFDWYAQWYPIMPVCDLDKRVPHAKKVMGLDLVVWWDRNENSWKVFNDACPHRLAPLSEGRIDQWGRLQCAYHGWCFSGSGSCKLIPQAPSDGPPVHTSEKACVAVYPSTVHYDLVWFWPNTDPQYKDIITKKHPPSIPELDDPSFIKPNGSRDFPYGYDVLIENVLDPAHLPYAHYGLVNTIKSEVKFDMEGGCPIDLAVKKIDIHGFSENQDQFGTTKFIAPCISYASSSPGDAPKKDSMQQRMSFIFICVPVSPGKSRLIWFFPRNFGLWADKVVPRWIFHLIGNLILDSDLYLLHKQERKFMDVGPGNWQKACFVPTKSDALLVGFRRWFNKYAGGQVDWRGRYCGALPSTPPRDQLFDRYWSHVVNCSSCSAAYKRLNALEMILQVASLAFIGFAAATKQKANIMVAMAVLCFAGSRWLAHFVYKNFHYHDYVHAFR